MANRAHNLHAARLVVSVVVVLTTLAWTGDSDAQTPTTQTPVGGLTLTSQSEWVTNEPFRFETRLDGDINVDETEFITTVYDRVLTRSQFQQTLDDENLGTSVILERRPLNEVLGPDRIIRSELPVHDAEQRRYYLPDNGVYPVKVELRAAGSGRSVDSFTTHIVNFQAIPQPEDRLQVSSIVPIRAPQPDPVSDALNLPDEGRSLASLASILGTYGSTPLVLDARPETFERLESSEEVEVRRIAAQLANTRNDRTVPRANWTRVGAPLYEPEYADELERQMERGREVLDEEFGEIDAETTIVSEQIGAEGLTRYVESGVERILIDEEAMIPQARATTLARPISLSTGPLTDPVPAVQIDGPAREHFLDDGGPVLGAHRLLADLAVIYNDLPGVRRGVAITAPDNWTTNSTFLNIYLRGISNSPAIEAAPIEDIFELPSDDGGQFASIRQVALDTEAIEDFPGDRVEDIRRQLNGLSTVVEPNSDLFDRLQRHMLSAESALVLPARRDDAFDGVQAGLNRRLDEVRLPSDRSISLTAREGEIPVSVQNDTGEPVEVVVRLDSNNLQFPGGESRTVRVERQQVTETFAINARTSGVFPVQVKVESPDGSLVLAESRILISSTAASGVGIMLSIGAGGFLLAWWARSLIKSRRK
jgi:hypothetical protein